MSQMLELRRKSFRLQDQELTPLAPGRGNCIASDLITREGQKVAFMYREEPDSELDSGWRFISGLESEEFMADADNHAICDCNLIANFDPEIVPLLDAPVGVIFEREDGSGPFVEVLDFVVPRE